TLRLPARSSDHICLVSGCCSSGRDFAPRFLQTVPRGSALALHSCFTSIRLHRGLSPPDCRTCPAHTRAPPAAVLLGLLDCGWTQNPWDVGPGRGNGPFNRDRKRGEASRFKGRDIVTIHR